MTFDWDHHQSWVIRHDPNGPPTLVHRVRSGFGVWPRFHRRSTTSTMRPTARSSGCRREEPVKGIAAWVRRQGNPLPTRATTREADNIPECRPRSCCSTPMAAGRAVDRVRGHRAEGREEDDEKGVGCFMGRRDSQMNCSRCRRAGRRRAAEPRLCAKARRLVTVACRSMSSSTRACLHPWCSARKRYPLPTGGRFYLPRRGEQSVAVGVQAAAYRFGHSVILPTGTAPTLLVTSVDRFSGSCSTRLREIQPEAD